MEEMNREQEIAVPRLHTEKGTTLLPVCEGEVAVRERQMQGDLVAASDLAQ